MRRRVTAVVCVCVSGLLFSIQRIGQEDLRIASALQSIDLKRGLLRKTASSQRYRIRVEAVLAHQSAILLALAGTQAYIYSCDVALDHVVLVPALPLCLVCSDIAHVHIIGTERWPRAGGIIRLKEGMSSVQCCSQRKEVALCLLR